MTGTAGAGAAWALAAASDAARKIHRPPGVRQRPTVLGEVGVILSALLAIGSVPALPALLLWLFWRAWKVPKEPSETYGRRRAWAWSAFGAALTGYLFLMFVPSVARPGLIQSRLFRWWLEYMSVSVAYRSGQPLPDRQYVYLLMPHGLYPFSGACAALSEMVNVFPRMRIAAAGAAFRVPLIRQLISWIGGIKADKASLSAALKAGQSVCLFPGGIGEMVRTDGLQERIILKSRRGFVKTALEHGAMEELYNVGQNMGQDVAGSPFSLEPGSMDAFSQEGLAEYMAGGGNIEEYLKSYEQMLQDGSAPDLNRGAVLDQVDAEGGITTQPKAGFVIKTRDMGAGTKIFLNVVSSEHVEAPHMKSFAELEGEEGCRVPLSVGTGLEDFDKKGEPCMTYDIVANPTALPA
ncbi:unnamed protein product [Polarella glacialis]|uniref:Acyltransferase n=1 Tax=Polarella glacialis TaxID=89957 RepID=A0A813JCE6_POLGL|nr:unnamed protein product [Polarella glacialis]